MPGKSRCKMCMKRETSTTWPYDPLMHHGMRQLDALPSWSPEHALCCSHCAWFLPWASMLSPNGISVSADCFIAIWCIAFLLEMYLFCFSNPTARVAFWKWGLICHRNSVQNRFQHSHLVLLALSTKLDAAGITLLVSTTATTATSCGNVCTSK